LKNENKNYFRLFAHCIPVRGAENSLIYDLQRADTYQISNDFFDILSVIENTPFDEIVEENNDLALMLRDLVNMELGFFCGQPESFPKLSQKWDIPSIISNAVVEYSKNTFPHIESIFKKLNSLFCRNVLLMFYDIPTKTELLELLGLSLNYEIYYIEIWLPKAIPFKKISKKYSNVRKLVFLNEKKDFVVKKKFVEIKYSRHKNFSDLCRNSDITKILDYSFYTESLHFNTCLNRKLSIDRHMQIKNCIFIEKSFGDFRNADIIDIVNSDKFQDLWYITKDNIKVCQDCQYRYMCQDCRAFTKNNSLTEKPSFCNFNPYE